MAGMRNSVIMNTDSSDSNSDDDHIDRLRKLEPLSRRKSEPVALMGNMSPAEEMRCAQRRSSVSSSTSGVKNPHRISQLILEESGRNKMDVHEVAHEKEVTSTIMLNHTLDEGMSLEQNVRKRTRSEESTCSSNTGLMFSPNRIRPGSPNFVKNNPKLRLSPSPSPSPICTPSHSHTGSHFSPIHHLNGNQSISYSTQIKRKLSDDPNGPVQKRFHSSSFGNSNSSSISPTPIQRPSFKFTPSSQAKLQAPRPADVTRPPFRSLSLGPMDPEAGARLNITSSGPTHPLTVPTPRATRDRTGSVPPSFQYHPSTEQGSGGDSMNISPRKDNQFNF
eukprot:Nk52_evm2s434 gene=Nk52_evmTU2s434